MIMPYGGKAHYGELSDAHIFRGAERNLVVEDSTCVTIPADWKLYLDNLSYINIEQADGTWVKAQLYKNHDRAAQTAKGYIMPVLELRCPELALAYPAIPKKKDIQPRIQGHVPSALVRTEAKPVAPVKQTRFTNDAPLAPAKPLAAPAKPMAAPAKPIAVPAKPMAAPAKQTCIANDVARPRMRRSSTSSTDAVSERAPIARMHKSGGL